MTIHFLSPTRYALPLVVFLVAYFFAHIILDAWMSQMGGIVGFSSSCCFFGGVILS